MTTRTALQTSRPWLSRTYGAFRRDGGGQEVARWFFSVGAAATGVAKSISAYDMTVSDGPVPPWRRA